MEVVLLLLAQLIPTLTLWLAHCQNINVRMDGFGINRPAVTIRFVGTKEDILSGNRMRSCVSGWMEESTKYLHCIISSGVYHVCFNGSFKRLGKGMREEYACTTCCACVISAFEASKLSGEVRRVKCFRRFWNELLSTCSKFGSIRVYWTSDHTNKSYSRSRKLPFRA